MFLVRVKSSLPIVLTTALAFLLLLYVSYGEALRIAPKFEKDKLQSQGELIQTAVESFLQSGLPLPQFIGFNQLAQPVLDADPTLTGISIRNISGDVVFNVGTPMPSSLFQELIGTQPSKIKANTVIDGSSDHHFRQILSLSNKFETVGSIVISSPTKTLSDTIENKFKALSPYLGGIVGIVFVFSIVFNGYARKHAWFLHSIFGTAFVLAAILTTLVIAQTYSEGTQLKTHAMANSLASRLNAVTELGLDFNNIDGIDRMITEYQAVNPDIKSISVNFDNRIRYNSQKRLIGTDWQSDNNAFEHLVKLDPSDKKDIQISVSIDKETVHNAVLANIKNFASLFIATGFIAILIIQLSSSLERNFSKSARRAKKEPQTAGTKHLDGDFMLGLIKPVYFIGVFVETLNASFLPQFLDNIVAGRGEDGALTATVFAIFFISFAIVLIPAGRFAKKHGSKPLLLAGALMSAAAQAMLALTNDLELVVTSRALSGAGQGLFLIGIQSFILQHSAQAKATQGAGIIVYGFNGGMISGAAIGSLLSVYMGISGVLMSAAGIAAFLTIYILFLVPSQETEATTDKTADESKKKTGFSEIFREIFVLFRDTEFTKTILLVGIPTKAVLTGVAIYALPMILTRFGYENDSIGQIIMFYAGGVLISSHFVSRLVDRVRRTAVVLLIGTALSSIGLTLIGSIGFDLDVIGIVLENSETYLAILGMFVLGLSHGFINAPVVTHVAETRASQTIGKPVSVATYRFLERIGHVVGPIIVANLLFALDQNPVALMYIGGAILFFGFLFVIPGKLKTKGVSS